jgi:hypothetical protein
VQETPELDNEQLVTDDTDAVFADMVRRLSRQSVDKHFDAYVDVPWDDHEIDPHDPTWILGENDPLGATAWYRGLPPETQARLGLFSIVSKMKAGLQFENILERGLLEFIMTLPNGAPEYRYAHHEVIEESQHSLMFQEFINRSGIDVQGMPKPIERASRRVVAMGRSFPALFFMFVLGGEDPIDHVQRESLRNGGNHPLMDTIMRIHVTEEARHLSFARNYLKVKVPTLGFVPKQILAIATPLILGQMGGLMLQPSRQMVAEFAIPAEVLREAYTDNPEYRKTAATALRKVRKLARELGLLNPVSTALWKRFNIYAAD